MKRYLLAALVLMITACQPVPYQPQYTMPRYDNLPKIPVNAAQLQVIQQYHSPMQPPAVEHLMPIAPSAAAEQWIRDRVQLVGTNGTVTFVISDAHVTEQALPRTKGIAGAFTKDQSSRFDGRLAVTAHLDANLPVASYADAESEVTIKRSLAEDATIQTREEMFYAMMKDMTQRFGDAIEPQLRARFNPTGSR